MVAAVYYGGESSKATQVDLTSTLGALRISGSELSVEYKLNECVIHQPIGNNPLIVELPDGSRLEIEDQSGFFTLCQNARHRYSHSVFQLESRWRFVGLALIFVVVFIYALIVYVLPIASSVTARYVPATWAASLDAAFIDQLDKSYFLESELSIARQSEIQEALMQGSIASSTAILFRRIPGGLPNAFALAGQTVILTDEIVNLMTIEELRAVFYHEIGHLRKRHLLQRMIKSSALGVLSLMILGDMPGLSESLLGGGVTLVNLSFARTDEEEADSYATDELILLGHSPHCLANAFSLLEKAYGGDHSKALVYLSTHPSINDRILQIKQKHKDKPPCE